MFCETNSGEKKVLSSDHLRAFKWKAGIQLSIAMTEAGRVLK